MAGCTATDFTRGQDGLATLVRLDEEPAGANCPGGGTAIHTGADSDGDGQLADAEISETSYVCNGSTQSDGGVLDGSYVIRNAFDVALLAPFKGISGDLIVQAPGLSALDLPLLQVVGGELTIIDNDTLDSLAGLSSLVSFKSLNITNNDELTDLSGLEGATKLSGDLTISSNEELSDVSALAAISSVEGDFLIDANPKLGSLMGLGNITTVVGDVTVSANDTLLSLSGLSALVTISGNLDVASNAKLATFGMDALTTVDGGINVSTNGSLTSLDDLVHVTSVGGYITISSNESLASVTLGSITSLSNDLYVQGGWIDSWGEGLSINNPSVASFSLPNLQQIGGYLFIEFASTMTNVEFPALTSLGQSLYVQQNTALSNLDLSSLVSVQGSTVRIMNNGNLPTCMAAAIGNKLIANGYPPAQVMISGNDDGGSC